MAGIYGLSGSGMDVDQLVKNLMKAQRTRYDSLQQKKTQLEWKKADYNTIYTSVNEFRNNTVFNSTLQGTLMPKQISSSNEAVVKVVANADAANVNHSLIVSQLATGITQTSSGKITTGSSKETLADQFGMESTRFKVTINGKEITIDPNQSINTVVSQINNAGAGVKANYDATLDRFFLYSTNTGSNAKIDFTGSDANGTKFLTQNLKLNTVNTVSTTGATSLSEVVVDPTKTLATQFPGMSGTLNFKITNDGVSKTLSFDATAKLQDVLDGINNAGVNAQASYDTVTHKFSLKATSGTLDFSGSNDGAIDFLTNKLNLWQTAQQGQDAKIVLDGTNFTQSSNDFTISGVAYSLKGIGTSSVNVSSDNKKTIDNVKSFIEAYNASLAKINTKINEDKYKDFMPLTDEQKSNMKEADVKAWEEKAKSGLLHNDPILRGLVSNMRNDIAQPISGLTGKYTTASSIGITTGAWQEGGKLYLDETKLKKALEEDPEIVNKIFGSHQEGNAHAQDGIAVRLHVTLKEVSDKIVTEAGITASAYDIKSNVGKQIDIYKKTMVDMNRRLKDIEANYYKKFNAMESALNKLNKQSSWLAQQSGGK